MASMRRNTAQHTRDFLGWQFPPLPVKSNVQAPRPGSSLQCTRSGAPRLGFGARAAPHASRRARGGQVSRMLGNTSSSLTWARSDHELRMRWGPRRTDRTGACFPRAQRGRPSRSTERAPTKVSHRAPQAPRVLSNADASSQCFSRSRPGCEPSPGSCRGLAVR